MKRYNNSSDPEQKKVIKWKLKPGITWGMIEMMTITDEVLEKYFDKVEVENEKLKIRLNQKYSFYAENSEHTVYDYDGQQYALIRENYIDFIPKKYCKNSGLTSTFFLTK